MFVFVHAFVSVCVCDVFAGVCGERGLVWSTGLVQLVH